MIRVPAKQAATDLETLLEKAAQGEEVLILDPDGVAFSLTPAPRPVFGSAKGQVRIGPDFDDPIEGFEDYS